MSDVNPVSSIGGRTKMGENGPATTGRATVAIVSRGRLALFVAAFFTAVGVANSAQLYVSAALGGEPIGWVRALVLALPFWWVKAALVPAVFLAARRLPPLGAGWWWRGPSHLGFSLLFAAAPLVLGGLLIVTVYPELGPASAALGQLFSSFFVVGVSIYWLLLASVHALDYYERYRERELDAARLARRSAELEANLMTARLQTLRMQLNPHFLFNTLNSISVLAMRGDGRRVVRMLDELAGVLRLTLDRTDAIVSLERELDLVDRYLQVEQVRFEDRLRVRQRVTRAARAAGVPSLILQPLVENAIKHGLGATPGCVEIEIGGRVEETRTEIWVHDTGPGFGRDTGGDRGVGLENTRLRLRALYGDDASVTLSPPGAGAEVRIALPYTRVPTSLSAGAA